MPLFAMAQSALPPCPSGALRHHCFGEVVNPSGNRYVGEWRDNKPHGQGTYIWASGGRYVGEYREGRRTGRGTHVFSNGNQYVGGFERDLFTGPGIEYSASGDVLRSGVWGQDRLLAAQPLDPQAYPFMPTTAGGVTATASRPTAPPSGTSAAPSKERPVLTACPATGTRHECTGEWVLEDGSRYVGEFRNGAFDGFGRLEGPHSVYVGDFRSGKYQGVGVLYTRTGQILG
ncbi:MAG: hypothetical protein RL087_1725, partial [Pseudomonadota bacterium]